MLDAHPQFTIDVIHGLGWFYLVVFAMNACWAYRSVKVDGHFRSPDLLGGQDIPVAAIWAIYSGVLMMIALAHILYEGDPSSFLIYLPDFVKDFADGSIGDSSKGPILFFSGSIFLFIAVVLLREWLVKPTVGWLVLNVGMVSLALSMTDYDFRQIVGKADNVPIVGMLFIVGFFTWLYFARAVDNDHRTAEGRPLREEEDNEKVLVWPDLVYSELICMVVLTVGLITWGILLQAPLEEAGNRAATPNPSKAPWYFLGLQEMLVYFDPWLAGVVLQFNPRRLDGLALHRFQPQRQRILHLRRPQVRGTDLHVRVSPVVGGHDHSGYVPAWPELEYLRVLRVLGRPQAGSAK